MNIDSVLSSIQRGPQRRVDVGHSKIAHWRFGSGPDLVLVHGWPLHSATFRAIVPRLADRFTCHLIDLPGVGQTETTSSSPVGLREHGDTLRTVVDRLGLEQVALLGHDSGGAVTRYAAAEMGSRVTALILAGTEIPGYRPWQLQAYLLAAKLPLGTRLFASSLRIGMLRRSGLAFGACFSDPRFADGEFGDLFVKPLLGDARVRAGQMRLLETFDWSVIDGLEAAHRRITAPTCMIWGEDDPFFPAALARKMAPQFDGEVEFHTIPSAKLFVHEERPDPFAQLARRFLERTDAVGATRLSA